MKKLIIILVTIVLAAGLFAALKLKASKSASAPKASPPTAQSVAERIVRDEALKNALNLYAGAKQNGTDFSNGPCLGIIAPDWVLDIAHNPRQPVDDLPENQCADFRNGSANHFIELDPDGNLIKVF